MLQCPYCATSISFTWTETNVKECTCGKVLRLKEGVLLNISLPAAGHSKNFIIPGSHGQWQGKDFTVTGRFVTTGEDSTFNYWNLIFTDGTQAYLGEGYGFYSILTPSTLKISVRYDKISGTGLNQYIDLNEGGKFYLIRSSDDLDIAVEGEIVLPDTASNTKISELCNPDGGFLTVIEFYMGITRYYDTVFTTFDELDFNSLTINEKAETHHCPKCKAPIVLKAAPYTVSLSCLQCGTNFNRSVKGNLNQTANNKEDFKGDIAIGTKGTLHGINFEVIGYSLKEELNPDESQWKEYVLWNRTHGFAFLSEFEGHWIYVKETARPPVTGQHFNNGFSWDGQQYQLYNAYSYKVVSYAGEHPYNVGKTKRYAVQEYIAPPQVWTSEEYDQSITWFLGEHIDSTEVYNTFPLQQSAPRQLGIGAVQPIGASGAKGFGKKFLLALGILLAIHIIIGLQHKNRLVLENVYPFGDTVNSVNIVSKKFYLEKSSSNLYFDITAPVDNNWFELSGSLINADNGKEYSFEKGVEYYSGTSDGERWTEGSTNSNVYLTAIPAGNYFLNLTGSRDPAGFNRLSSFSVKVLYDVRSDRNLIFAFIIFCIFGAIQYFMFYNKEKKRWNNSRYSPYNYES